MSWLGTPFSNTPPSFIMGIHSPYGKPFCCQKENIWLGPDPRSFCKSLLWGTRMILNDKALCVLTWPLCRFTGRIIKDVINMGSYNFLGLAARYDESMRTVKDVLESYGVGVASTRHEMGMYIFIILKFCPAGLGFLMTTSQI